MEQRKISRFDSRRRANCRGLCSRVPRGAPPLCRKVLRCQKRAALQWKAAGRRAEKRAAARTGSGALVPISVPASAARAAQKHASAIPRRHQMPRGGAKRKARFKPLSGSLVPARGHGGRAAGRARQGCVYGAGYPVRSFEQRNAPARSGGSDGPPARPSGSRAGSPPARLARRPAEPVNRRSSVGGPTREAARPTVRETRISGPLRAFLPAAARGRAFPGRGPGEDMEAFASKRASDPFRRSFPGALRRRRAAAKAWTAPPPFGCKHGPSDGKTAAGECGRLRSGSRRVLPAGKKRSGKPDHSKARTGFARADTPGKPLRQGQNAPQPASGKRPGRARSGAPSAVERRLDEGRITRPISDQKASRRSLSAHIRVAAQLLGIV